MKTTNPYQKQKWKIQQKDSEAAKLAQDLKVSPILAQILINRDITASEAARNFLHPKLTDLIAPEKMPGTAIANYRPAAI